MSGPLAMALEVEKIQEKVIQVAVEDAIRAERERCAKIAEEWLDETDRYGCRGPIELIAAAIRSGK